MLRHFTHSASSKRYFFLLTVLVLLAAAFLLKGRLFSAASTSHHAALPVPEVDLAVEGKELPSMALIGEKFCYTARIENKGDMVGFNPYLHLILPPHIIIDDPSTDVALPGVCTGPSCDENSSYPIPLPAPFTCNVPTGCTGMDPNGVPYTVPFNHTLWLIQPPIGSLYPGEPGIDVRICLRVKDDAALDVPVPICHQPLFQYDQNFGAPVLGIKGCPDVMPVVVKLSKRALNYTSNKTAPNPTVETPTGSCHPVTFELVANIADSKTVSNLRFKDMLPPEMTLVANSVTVVGVPASAVTDNSGGNMIDVTISSDTGELAAPPAPPPDEFNKEDLIIRFQAYVNNNVLDPNTCASARITNRAMLDADYDSKAIAQQTAALLIEVEHVTIQKTTDRLRVVPGEMVTYTLNFQVSQNITANNVTVVDELPNGISYAGPTTLNCGSPLIVGPSVTVLADGKTRLVFNIGSAFTLPGCTSCSLSYRGVVAQTYNAPLAGQPVRASDPLVNQAVINYSIAGGASNCSDDTVGAVVVRPVAITKSIVNPKAEYLPGDVVRFRLRLDIPSGDTRDIEFKDFLPAPIFNATQASGFTIVTTNGCTAATAFSGGTPTASSADNSITFKFADVTATTPQCIEIEFNVSVTTNPFPDDLFLTNLFQSKTTNTAGQPESHLTGVAVHVRAPKLKITKGVFGMEPPVNPSAVISPLPSATPVDGNITGVDANDKITFYITVKNEGGAQAVNCLITDVVPSGLMYVPGSLMQVTSLPLVGLFDTNAPTLMVNAIVIQPGQTLIVKFTAMLPAAIQPCQIITNTASVTWRSTVTGNLFPAVSDSATVTVARPAITKTITGTDQAHTTGNNVVIGEFVFYQIKIQVPEGSFPGVTVTETLPPGMSVIYTLAPVALLDSDITVTGSTTGVLNTTGQTATFSLGTVTNANTANVPRFITINIGAVVLNTAANVNGTTLTNTVKWVSTGCDITATTPVRVVEPKLQIVKVAKNAAGQIITTADAGDTITYELTISHTGASTADAFVVVLSDLIPPGQTYKPGSLMHVSGLAPDTGTLHQPTSATDPITAAWFTFPLGATSTIKFSTMVNENARPCADLTNRATITWASIPGGIFPPEPRPLVYFGGPNFCPRTGNPSGCGLNNYVATATASLAVPGPKITKAIQSTSNEFTSGANVTIGEEITYRICIELPEGVTPSLVLQDVLPPGLGIVDGAFLLNFPDDIPGVPQPTTSGGATCAAGGGGTMTISFSGSINVPVDGNPANNFLCLRLRAVVCNVAGNMGMPGNQTALPNTVTAQVSDIGGCSASATVEAKVVEPKLTLRKLFDPAMAMEGDTVTITLAVINNGLSTAHSVVVEDAIPLALFDNATLTPCGPLPAGFTFTNPIVGPNTVVTFTGGNVAPGQTIPLCFRGTLKRRCLMDKFNNVALIKQAWTLPLGCSGSDCIQPVPADEARLVTAAPTAQQPDRGRDVSGATATANLMINPSGDCPCVVPPAFANMVEWLKFDEASGEDAGDTSSFNNDGVLKPNAATGPTRVTATSTTVMPAVGSALSFDGVGDWVEVPNSASLNFGTGSLTIDAWIRPTPASLTNVKTIVDKRSSTSGPGYKLFLFNGRLGFQLNAFNFIAAAPLTADVWTHVAAVAFRSGGTTTATLYVNGVSVLTQATTAITGSSDSTSPLYVGRGIPADGDFFAGLIDEVEIFNTVLAQARILSIVNAGKGGKCPPLPPIGDCCGKKPQLPDLSNALGDKYSDFTGQVAVATCHDGNAPFGLSGQGYSLVVVDLQHQQGAPEGVEWKHTSAFPPAFYHRPEWKRNSIGDVFGVTLDDGGNIYVAASAIYGDGPHLITGTAGAGGVYKISNGTGLLTPFVKTDNVPVYGNNNLMPNTGSGLGNIAFDCAHQQFYVTNFEDGLIYRLDPNGNILPTRWDHGSKLSLATTNLSVAAAEPNVLDSGTNGPTSAGMNLRQGRRVWAVKAYQGRLYYSVWRVDQNRPNTGANTALYKYNEIWSVGLNASGDFVGAPHLEIRVPLFLTTNYSMPISDISFGPAGTMLLAERAINGDFGPNPAGYAHRERLLEYAYNNLTGIWVPSGNLFQVGNFSTKTNSSGGNDYDRGPFGRVWATGDALLLATGVAAYGLQGIPFNGLAAGPNTTKSLIIDLDGDLSGTDKTQIGDVAIPCPTAECAPPTLTSPALFNGSVTEPYANFTLTATGGAGGYTFAAAGLPPGLTLTGNVISGTPTQKGSFVVTITVTDERGCRAYRTYVVQIFGTIVVPCCDDPRADISRLEIAIDGQGDEQAVSFSLNFDPAVFGDPQVTLGADARGAMLQVNSSQAAQGRLGISVTLPAGQNFGVGERKIAEVAFTLRTNRVAQTTISFGDQPTVQAVIGANGNPVKTLFAARTLTLARPMTSVSAADYDNLALAPDSIVSAFGSNLATAIASAATLPLPTQLAGTSISVRDSAGTELLAPLFFVSPTQVNYLLPPGLAPGEAIITLTGGDGAVSMETVTIAWPKPGLFSADASGRGLAAASVLRVRADGTQAFEPVATFDPAQGRFVPVPIDLGPAGDQVFLLLFGTGIKLRSDVAAVLVNIGGVMAPVSYAGAQGGFVGLDQVNVLLPRELAGRGLVDITLTADGILTNAVQIQIR